MQFPQDKLVYNPGVERWIELRSSIQRLRNMKLGDDLHQSLLSSGCNERLLSAFLETEKRPKKFAGFSPSESDVQNKVDALLGGDNVHVSGGNALRRYLFIPETSRDVDIFFPDFVSFARATIETLEFPSIDVCLYDQTPYEAFDITASQVSFDRDHQFHFSAEFESAISTGVARIRPDFIIQPAATLRRVAKYGRRYRLTFPASDIITLAAFYGVRDDIVKDALQFAR